MRRFERPSDNADDRITHVCIRVTFTTSLGSEGSDTFFGLRVGPVDRQRGTAGLEQARFDHPVARVDVAGERVGAGEEHAGIRRVDCSAGETYRTLVR